MYQRLIRVCSVDLYLVLVLFRRKWVSKLVNIYAIYLIYMHYFSVLFIYDFNVLYVVFI